MTRAEAARGVLQWFAGLNWPVILLVLFAMLWLQERSRSANAEEIARVREEMVKVQADKDRLQETLSTIRVEQAGKQQEIAAAQREVERLTAEKDKLEAQVVELEHARDVNALNLRALDKDEDVEARFAAAYPEITKADKFGVHDIENEDGVVQSYVVIPLWHVVTFLTEHDALATAVQVRGLYDQIVDKYGSIHDIDKRIATLEREKFDLERRASAVQAEYIQQCDARYDTMANRYMDYMEKPRLELPKGWITTGAVVGGFLLGGAACISLQN